MRDIPSLRFKEFNDKWEEKKYKEIFQINQGLQIAINNRYLEPASDRVFYITNEILKNDNKIKFYIKNPPTSVICDEKDILMTRTGNTGEVVTNVNGAFHNNFFKINYDINHMNKYFIFYLLKSFKIQKTILKLAGTSTIPDLNHSDFYKIKSYFPSLEEQEKIGDFLSTVDSKIEKSEKKLELLKEYKKGVMEKIFTQKIRFKDSNGENYPEWEEKKLGEITTYVDYRGKTPEKTKTGIFLVTAKNIKMGYIDYNISKEYVAEEKYNEIMKRGKVKKGEVLLTTEAPLGNIAQIDREDIALAQRVIKFNGNSGLIKNTFLKYNLMSYKFQQKLKNNAIGTTVLGIQGKVLHNLSIYFSSLEEQEKIGDFLSTIDEKLEREEKKLEDLKEFKKGLLQKMFV